MKHSPWMSPIFVAILVAIGCGSGTPQDASATPETKTPEPRIQLAQVPADPRPVVAIGGTASIQGTVQLTGEAPAPTKVRMAADPACQQQGTEPVYTEGSVVNESGMLKNVLVFVKEGAEGSFPTPEEPVVLNQSGCWYAPHVFGVQVNQPIEIRNSDATLHNINAKPKTNRPFNVAQPIKGMKTTKKFTKPEVGVKFKCNVHPWMNAYAGVFDHPFFSVSDEGGAFTISGLPTGTYVLEAWHEQFGTQTQTVSVSGGESASVEFTFAAP